MEILKIHNNPERAEWAALTERFTREEEEITRQVTEILADVKSGGDRSLREVTRRVEGRDPRTFEIPADVRAAAAALIPAALQGEDASAYAAEVASVTDALKSELASELKAGLELRLSKKVHTGFRLCAKDGSGYIDCSDEELAEQLAPFFRELRI